VVDNSSPQSRGCSDTRRSDRLTNTTTVQPLIIPSSYATIASSATGPVTFVERAAHDAEADSTGLPVGMQVVARHWREDLILAVMATLERHFAGRSDHPANPL
jgi:Asp-tRNA(Asn)/Glu-tRNA(Gln) amidotransferase A subunit family amidase